MKTAHTTLIAILSAACVITASAARNKPQALDREVRKRIHTLHVVSNLGRELQYMNSNATIFTETKEAIPDASGLLTSLPAEVQKALESRGYTIAKEPALADAVLVLDPAEVRMPTWDVDVMGAGFLHSRPLGMDLGVIALARINFQIKDAKGGAVLASASITRYTLTKLKRGQMKWAAFTEADQQALIAALRAELQTVGDEGVTKLGF